jgi:hypothetical protein
MKDALKPTTVLFILFIIAAGIAIYSFGQYQQTKKQLNVLQQNPQTQQTAEVKDLVDKVGKLVEIPKEEVPTIATVVDFSKLKDQPFFTHSQNGDKVLIYTQAKRAILYRPGSNKIIEVAPVTIGQQNNTIPTVKVALYNGSANTNANNNIEKQLKDKISNVDVVAKQDASKKNYDKTLIVDVSGTKTQEAQQLAQLLNGTVSTLPGGEAKPNADLLVILGGKQ